MNTHRLLRETGQMLSRQISYGHATSLFGVQQSLSVTMPLYLCWFRCAARFWNSMLTTNNALLSKINEADLLLAHRTGSWAFYVLSALCEIPGADVHISAVMSRSKTNMSDFELLLREQTMREWRDLAQIHPHDLHVSSRVMRTKHAHLGVPLLRP